MDLTAQISSRDIRIVLNTTVDAQIIETEKPDYVILATGALPLALGLPGVDQAHIVQAWDVLRGISHTGDRIVIIGGGAVGVETALFLAEKGTISGEILKFLLINKVESFEDLFELATRGTKTITLVEMTDRIGKDIGQSTRWNMLQELRRMGVRTRSNTKALAITSDGVTVQTDETTKEEIPSNTVVLAVGSTNYNPLQTILEAKNISFRVVGDATRVATAFEAVRQGYAAGRSISKESENLYTGALQFLGRIP